MLIDYGLLQIGPEHPFRRALAMADIVAKSCDLAAYFALSHRHYPWIRVSFAHLAAA